MATIQLMKVYRIIYKAISLAVIASIAFSNDAIAVATPGNSKPIAADSQKRFIFSWPVTDAPELTPRGGSTQGPELTLDNMPSKSWQQLQENGITDFEKDRRAIIAMAGSYRVTFDFLEVITYDTDPKPQRPYQSWGTERVYIDKDDDRFISLSHILEMRVVQDDGTLSEPIVMKHWRQDWQYEPTQILEYRGHNQWQLRKSKKISGQWSQTVYQVDDSPRYASYGKWQHSTSASTWISGETWRPLPRREWSVRKDYDVLIGTNRHTIVPTGWFQEENNLKAILDKHRKLSVDKPYLGREYGVARYQRLKDPDFKAADEYYTRTKYFWNDVKNAWAKSFYNEPTITLKAQVDQAGLFVPLFEYANTLSAGEKPSIDSKRIIQDTLKGMRK